MRTKESLFEKIRIATRTLLSDGPSAATVAIQKALNKAADHAETKLPPVSEGTNFDEKKMPQPGAKSDFVSDLLSRLGLPSSEESTSQPSTSGQFLTKSFTNQAGTRSYKLYLPASYHGQPMPVVVMLHGCTQNPDDFAMGTCMNTVAEEKQCLVVYPAQSQSANSSKCWNWFKPIDQQRDQGEPSIIAGITLEVVSTYGFDANRVYVAGFSAGAAMAVIMAAAYPDVYAAVGVHSGLPYASARDLPSALAAMRGGVSKVHEQDKSGKISGSPSTPIIVFHGDRDKTVNACNGDKLIEQSVSEFIFDKKHTGSRTKLDVIVEEGKVPNGHHYTRTSHHNEDGLTLAEHWLIHGAAHAWAGGSKSGSYTDAGGPDATREMLRFFYLHS